MSLLYFPITCRNLEVYYPHFPSVADFTHGILSYGGDLEQHSEGDELKVLSIFSQGWKTFQAGCILLPDLVEFYRWLHLNLGKDIAHYM